MTRRIAIAAALALSLGALPLLAQDPAGVGTGGFGPAGLGAGGGQRMGGQGRGGPGPVSPGMGGPMGVLPGLNRVDLTDTQREQIRAILEQARPSGDPAETMRQAEQALHTAVLAEVADPQAIDTAKAALNTAQAADLDRRVELMLKVAQVLTPAQRQELAQLPPPPGPGARGRGRGPGGQGPGGQGPGGQGPGGQGPGGPGSERHRH